MEVRIDEPAPSGGAYSIAFYTNEDGDDCSVEEATLILIHEYSVSANLSAKPMECVTGSKIRGNRS